MLQTIAGWDANSIDPEQMLCSVVSNLGLHCLLKLICLNTYSKYCIPQNHAVGTHQKCLAEITLNTHKMFHWSSNWLCCGPFCVFSKRMGEKRFWLCWGLTTRQPLRVILCRLPEKGRKEIEERVEEMKERDREERGTGMKVKKQKK